jgi:hypothetical protein
MPPLPQTPPRPVPRGPCMAAPLLAARAGCAPCAWAPLDERRTGRRHVFRFSRGEGVARHPSGQTTRPRVTGLLYANVRGSPPAEYEALTTPRGLSGWSTSDVEAQPVRETSGLFGFNQQEVVIRARTESLVSGSQVEWLCEGDVDERKGTRLRFTNHPRRTRAGDSQVYIFEPAIDKRLIPGRPPVGYCVCLR